MLRGDGAPGEGDAAAELAEPRHGADDDAEPASTDVPAGGGHVNAIVAAQLGERLRSSYAGSAATTGRAGADITRCG
jgi:hypothetical protein